MKLIFSFIIIFLSLSVHSSDLEIIELHENKSLDQLVIDQINQDKKNLDIENVEDENAEVIENNVESSLLENNVEKELIVLDEDFFTNTDPNLVKNILNNSNNIKSNILQSEFDNYLFNLDLNLNEKKNREIYFNIVDYFYKTGNLSKSYSLIKTKNLEKDQNINFYYTLELNHLLSTFQLEQVCNFKDQLNDINFSNSNLKDKIEIFCLILNNNLSEATLLNSIMQETENEPDINFQNLFSLLIGEESLETVDKIWFDKKINSNLIFLYSAMARIAELPLTSEFLKVDPLNMSIPIILNKSTPIDLRIKAANESLINGSLTIDSLAALYQSVDFTSNQLNNVKTTVNEFSDNIDVLMAYYFQLINIQIFPSERLEALVNFWNFAKEHNLEEIAYPLTYKIIDSIDISSDYILYSLQISTAYIFNNEFEKAVKWLDFYESANGSDNNSIFVRLLLDLYSLDDVSLIIEKISLNLDMLANTNNYNNQELLYILFDILGKQQKNYLNDDINKIFDDRAMPSIFISEKINNAVINRNNNELLIYSVVSLNNKEWKDVHPLHLKMILKGFLEYKNGKHLKNLILEIFNNYKIL